MGVGADQNKREQEVSTADAVKQIESRCRSDPVVGEDEVEADGLNEDQRLVHASGFVDMPAGILECLAHERA